MVEHTRIGTCLADNAADARTCEAVGKEFARCRAHDLLAAFCSFAARAPARRRRRLASRRQVIGFAIGHVVVTPRDCAASFLARLSKALSLPLGPTSDSPIGQPRQRPSGSATCGAPQCPASEVSVSAFL